MQWLVKTDNSNVELSTFEVLNLLLAKVISKERPDHEELSKFFVHYLQNSNELSNVTSLELASMAFEIGYFYRIFKEKNKVEILEESEEPNPSGDETPASSISMPDSFTRN